MAGWLLQGRRGVTWCVLDTVVEVCEGVVVLDLHQRGHLLRRILECLQGLRARHAIDCQVRLLCIWAQKILYKGGPTNAD